MPEIPVLSSRQVVRTPEKLRLEVARRKGSHIVMVRGSRNVTLSIPDHNEVARGTLRSLIRSAELTVAEFLEALQD